MRRIIYICSTLTNGALTLFKKSFEKKSSALLTIGTTVPPVDVGACGKGVLKQGVVTNVVKTSEDIEADLIGTETTTEDLRNCYTPERGWEEVSSFPG